MSEEGNNAEELEIEGAGVDEEIEEGAAVPELDEDGNEVQPEVEAWMQEEDPDDAGGDESQKKVKLSTKQKLRGKLEDSEAEITLLRNEVEALKKGNAQPEPAAQEKRPRSADFDTDEEYEDAVDVWHEKKNESQYSTFEKSRTDKADVARQVQEREDSVSGHYERAEKLIEDSGISLEVYKAADTAVRKAVDAIIPNSGDTVVDHMISVLGDGSEKTMYYLGRNKVALNEFRALLSDDPSGLKASVYLGKITEKIAGSKNKPSQARKPAANVKGDEVPKGPEGRFKKQYSEAKSGQKKYDIKKAARAAGHDTSKW